nr:colicin E3/pyocin S6 family cytotoxin [Rhodococcus sp. Eu-32]
MNRKGNSRWRNAEGSRLYEWDSTHGHIEAYNKRGHHVGVLDSETGQLIGAAVKGRSIDV